jgi:RNA polymerase sigma-70 factor (ECF subfamily)
MSVGGVIITESHGAGASMKPLADRLASGEEAAFVELYDVCANRLHQYVAMRMGSRDAAADVVQSAYLRAVKSRRRFRGLENPVAYMFQIARNEAARAAKRVAARSLPVQEWFDTASDGVASDDTEVIAMALGRLDANDREIVELKIYGALAFREIAAITGLPQSTVATRYRRALESLRGWVAKQYR